MIINLAEFMMLIKYNLIIIKLYNFIRFNISKNNIL